MKQKTIILKGLLSTVESHNKLLDFIHTQDPIRYEQFQYHVPQDLGKYVCYLEFKYIENEQPYISFIKLSLKKNNRKTSMLVIDRIIKWYFRKSDAHISEFTYNNKLYKL